MPAAREEVDRIVVGLALVRPRHLARARVLAGLDWTPARGVVALHPRQLLPEKNPDPVPRPAQQFGVQSGGQDEIAFALQVGHLLAAQPRDAVIRQHKGPWRHRHAHVKRTWVLSQSTQAHAIDVYAPYLKYYEYFYSYQ